VAVVLKSFFKNYVIKPMRWSEFYSGNLTTALVTVFLYQPYIACGGGQTICDSALPADFWLWGPLLL